MVCGNVLKRGTLIVPAELQACTTAVVALASEADAILDETLLCLSQYYLDPSVFHVCSGRMLENLCRADLPMLHSSHIWNMHCKTCSANTLLWHMTYVEFQQYDETPLKDRLESAESSAGPWMNEMVSIGSQIGNLVLTSKGQVGIAKILQARSAYGIMISTFGLLIGLTGKFFSHLQAMSKTTSDVLCECLARCSALSDFPDQCKLRLRSVCCDHAPSNLKGERELIGQRGSRWTSAVYGRAIHSIAGIYKKCFEGLVPEVVSGLLHFSLSLQTHDSWVVFRRCLCEELDSREVVVIHSAPPTSLVEQKVRLLQTLYEGSSGYLADVLSLMCGLNGDWGKMKIEIYWAPWHGAPPAVSEMRQIIRKTVLDTLARARPPTWPQHRWTGFRESVRGVLMFMHCHNLLLNTYKRFMRGLHHRASSVVGQHSAEDDVRYDLAYHDGVADEDELAKAVQQSSGAENQYVPA
eukprot:6480417-Amphidinium_carterae.1